MFYTYLCMNNRYEIILWHFDPSLGNTVLENVICTLNINYEKFVILSKLCAAISTFFCKTTDKSKIKLTKNCNFLKKVLQSQ